MRFKRMKIFHLEYFLLIISIASAQDDCNRKPATVKMYTPKSFNDGRFGLKLKEEVKYYQPGNTYTLLLYGTASMNSVNPPHKFTSFNIVIEPLESSSVDSDIPLGVFDFPTEDSLVKMSDHCRNMITQASYIPKTEVQVQYTAPAAGTGCVVFKASVLEQKDLWYEDDGGLTLSLCEDSDSGVGHGSVNSLCCACDEAKYELTFEGLWSRYTHPKEFPRDSWLTRFSDLIGASHTSNYRFWEHGGIATEGLRQVAERGSTRTMEAELKAQSEHIRTIIKARGISYPNVTMGKTFAVFRVDRKKHLISLVSMIDPSPDWIVGVSGLELCLSNCTWLASKTVDLYPYDVGTDSGKTYISPDQPTMPREKITKMNTTWPPESPFFDAGELKPLARLRLERQRLYDKSCMEGVNKNDVSTGGENPDGNEPAVTEAQPTSTDTLFPGNVGPPSSLVNEYTTSTQEPVDCLVSAWSAWSPCSSTTCGVKGTKTKTRTIEVEPKNGGKPCPKLERTHGCKPQGRECSNALKKKLKKVKFQQRSTTTLRPKSVKYNKYSEWSDWTACTEPCGLNSIRQRTRTVISSSFLPCNDRLEEEPCSMLPCNDE